MMGCDNDMTGGMKVTLLHDHEVLVDWLCMEQKLSQHSNDFASIS